MKIMSIWKQTAENEDNNSKQYDEFNAAFDYVYNTKRDIVKKYQISNAKLTLLINSEEDEIYNGFIWKLSS